MAGKGVRKGVSFNGDPRLCMVVGCGRKALYRNAESVKVHGTQRGYCSEHREMASSRGTKRHASSEAWFSRMNYD